MQRQKNLQGDPPIRRGWGRTAVIWARRTCHETRCPAAGFCPFRPTLVMCCYKGHSTVLARGILPKCLLYMHLPFEFFNPHFRVASPIEKSHWLRLSKDHSDHRFTPKRCRYEICVLLLVVGHPILKESVWGMRLIDPECFTFPAPPWSIASIAERCNCECCGEIEPWAALRMSAHSLVRFLQDTIDYNESSWDEWCSW